MQINLSIVQEYLALKFTVSLNLAVGACILITMATIPTESGRNIFSYLSKIFLKGLTSPALSRHEKVVFCQQAEIQGKNSRHSLIKSNISKRKISIFSQTKNA